MSDSDALQVLAAAARAPLSEWPVCYPHLKAMGVLCSYVPEEMVHAAGLAPVRIRANAAPLRRVDAHLQSFTCALCRSTFDQALGGELGFLAGTVFAHTCDAMQALADLWRMPAVSGASYLVDTIMQPANLGSPAARPYLLAELNRFRKSLSSFVGCPIGDDELRASIALYDETRRLVGELREKRDRLSASKFLGVLDTAQKMPREMFNPLLAELLGALEGAARHSDGRRLFLVGAVLDEPRLADLVEELGAQVAGDDLCSGSRHFYGQIGTDGDPLANLADYYLRRPPCPTKYHPAHDPGRYLLDQVRGTRADGVVLVLEKFCEPHAFDYALIRPTLDQAGVPYLLLEMEQTPSLEALRTRMQAFIEIL